MSNDTFNNQLLIKNLNEAFDTKITDIRSVESLTIKERAVVYASDIPKSNLIENRLEGREFVFFMENDLGRTHTFLAVMPWDELSELCDDYDDYKVFSEWFEYNFDTSSLFLVEKVESNSNGGYVITNVNGGTYLVGDNDCMKAEFLERIKAQHDRGLVEAFNLNSTTSPYFNKKKLDKMCHEHRVNAFESVWESKGAKRTMEEYFPHELESILWDNENANLEDQKDSLKKRFIEENSFPEYKNTLLNKAAKTNMSDFVDWGRFVEDKGFFFVLEYLGHEIKNAPEGMFVMEIGKLKQIEIN